VQQKRVGACAEIPQCVSFIYGDWRFDEQGILETLLECSGNCFACRMCRIRFRVVTGIGRATGQAGCAANDRGQPGNTGTGVWAVS